MEAPVKVSLVLPAYNEEEALEGDLHAAVEALQATDWEWEIIVVDDGSTDGTAEIAASFPEVRLIRHPYNMGGGAARSTGIRHATGEVVVISDGDGTYPMRDIPRLVEALDDCEMVVGARTKEAGTLKFLRVPTKFLIRKLAEFISGARIPDLNSGMRAMRRETALPYLHMLPNGHSWVSTITLAFLTNSHPVKYVPIDYYPRKGKSTFHPVRDTGNYLMTIFRTITWFSPLKIFLPLAMLLLLTGTGKLIADVVRYSWRVTPSTVILVLGGLQILVLGLIADMIAKRSSP
ncbi:MAG: glycosyltransferase family 2 protein [Actinomycetota bacterium]|nr:glycosyltransferase family 2 protein [Actinomycetota bacterium]